MGRMTPEIMMTELNLMWQDVFTWVSWGIVLLMVIIAWMKGKQENTHFYLIAIFAVFMGAFIEPLYDVAFDLWFHDVHNGQPGAMYSHFTAFGVIQPYWTHSGYIILYATACLYAGKMLYEGRMTGRLFALMWFGEILASCVFEVIGTGVGVYSYYGPYVLRIWNYPFVIGVLEGTQTILFTLVAVEWWRRATTPSGLWGLCLIFPVMMVGTNFGLGGPIIIALHISEPFYSTGLIWVGTILSIVFCTFATRGAYRVLVARSSDAIRERENQRGVVAA